MDSRLTTIPDTTTQTVTRGQLDALRQAIRAAAEANPSRFQDKGQRCAEFTRTVCAGFGHLDRLADLPAQSFPAAMQMVAELAKPVRWHGPAEAGLKGAGTRLDAALSGILQAQQAVEAYRREAEGILLPRLREALGGDDGDCVAGMAHEALASLLAGRLLDVEDALRHAHETLHSLASRLPHVGRALDAGAGPCRRCWEAK